MPIVIRRTCQFCREPVVDGVPSCDCCPSCGGTADGDYGCDECLEARDAMKKAARDVWQAHLKAKGIS